MDSTDLVLGANQDLFDLTPVFSLGGKGDQSSPQAQARLDMFLRPDEKARLQAELRVITDEYGQLALANIESAEASLAMVREAISSSMSGNGGGQKLAKKIEEARPKSGAKPVTSETAISDKSACVLSLIQSAGSQGISRSDLVKGLRHNQVFNPKSVNTSGLVRKAAFYLRALKKAGLVENHGKTALARWYLTGESSGKSEVSSRVSAQVTDLDNQEIVLDALRRQTRGVSVPGLSAILCLDRRFNTQRETPSVISSKVLHYLEKLEERGSAKRENTKDGTLWFSAGAPVGEKAKSAVPEKKERLVGAKVPKKKGGKKGILNPTKMDLLRLIAKSPGISGRELNSQTSGYPNLRNCSSSKISNSLFLLKQAGLIVNKGKNPPNSCWHLTATGKKEFEKSNSDEEASDDNPKKASKHSSSLKVLPKRPPPQLKVPLASGMAGKLKELSAGSEDWEKLVLVLLESLDSYPTFEELVQAIRSNGKSLGYNVDLADSFLENQVRNAVLRLEDNGHIARESGCICLLTETPLEVGEEVEDAEAGGDDDLEVFKQDVETEDVPRFDNPPDEPVSEEKNILLDSSSTSDDWRTAILEAIEEICAESDSQDFTLEQLLDCFRENGGTKNCGISIDLDESDFEDEVSKVLTLLEEQSVIVMLGDQDWQVV